VEINKTEIKKILIKVPSLGESIFSVFPFLIILSEEFPKAELNIIVEEGDHLAFSFLPFKTNVYIRPLKSKKLIETHRFVANLHEVFNIDIFFDLENSFNSAFIGYNFRSKIRVGFEMGWNKHLLTCKYQLPKTNDFERNSIFLLENFLEKSFADLKISHQVLEVQKNEKIEKLFQEPEQPKFILIMLDNFSNVTKDIDLWKKFFDSFEKQKFVIWSKDDEDIISELFAKIDLERNELFMHRGSFSKELNYILSKMMGIVVNNSWAEGLCSYYNLSYVHLVSKAHAQNNFHYFKSRPLRIVFENLEKANLVYLDEDKVFNSFNEVVDFLHFNFKI
jgi:ADP-heptose:LPS heptosyltransferase